MSTDTPPVAEIGTDSHRPNSGINVSLYKRDKNAQLQPWRHQNSDSVIIVNEAVELRVPDSFSFGSKANVKQPLKDILSKISSGVVTGTLVGIGAASTLAESLTGGNNQLVESLRTAANFNPWFKYIQAWESTDPLEIDLEFKFSYGQFGLWNAKEEVVKPVLALLDLVVPEEADGIFMTGPFQSVSELYINFISAALQGAGESISSFGEASFLETIGDFGEAISSRIFDSATARTCYLGLGKTIALEYCYCLGASVSLSNEVDQDGWPISGSASLSFAGFAPPVKSGRDNLSGRESRASTYRFMDYTRR